MPGTDIELARALFPKAKDVVAAGLGSSVTVRTERGRAVSDSSEGLVEVVLDTVVAGGDATIECPTSCSISEGDEVLVYISGTTPVDVVVAGEGDRQDERIHAIEADYVKASTLEADVADIGFLKADSATIKGLQADTAKVHDLTADQLSAATAYIASLNAKSVTAESLAADVAKVHDLTADGLSAAAAYIAQLSADSVTAQRIAAISGDFDTVRANAAKVANLTAAELEADHATIGSLDANYAKITNGHIDSALIDTAAIVDEQVFTVTGNKATLAQIDASKINVLNLKAKDIEVERINGQAVTGKTLVDALTQHESDISDLDSKIDDEVEALNDRIDGAIETFTGTAVPTLSNAPASSWNTTTLKDQHVGDVYYVVNSQSAQNGYCYRFTKSGSTYSWQLIKDSDVTAALSRLQTAEGKIGDIEQFDVTVGSFMTDTDDKLSSLKTRATSLETSLGDKVDTSTFNTVSQKVDANEANITSMSTVLTNNGLTSSTNITNTVNTVRQTAEANTSSISSLTQTVNNKADSTTVTTLTNRVSTVEQNLSGITTRVGKTESELDTVSNPNLSPFFSHSISDVYNASTNPNGYWKNVGVYLPSGSTGLVSTWDLEQSTSNGDGWAHLVANNTSSGNIFAFSYIKRGIQELKPSTKYTFLVEWLDLTISGSSMQVQCPTAHGGTNGLNDDFFATTGTTSITANGSGNNYIVVSTRAAYESACDNLVRAQLMVTPGTTVDGYFRISLYEGEYSGPYKPYVDQTLSSRVKTAETSIEQNAEDITLRATKTDVQSLGGNLLTDTDNPVLGSNIAPKYSVVSGGNGTGMIATVTDSPLPNFKKSFRITGNTSGNRDFAQSVGIVYGQKYLFTTYARGIGGNATALIRVFSGSELFTYTTVIGTNWTPIRTIVTLTGSGSSAYYFFQFGLTGAGSIEYIAPCLSGGAAANTAAELKVQSDRIGMVVSNADASSSLALTADAMEYIGNHVEINGTDGTSTVISGGKIQANSLTLGAMTTDAQADILNSNVQVGGRNLLRYAIYNYADANSTISVYSTYRGMYCAVDGGETYTISRRTVEGNRFWIEWTEQEPASGVALHQLSTNNTVLKVTVDVPSEANWLFIYLSNQSDVINDGNIKVERGNKATDWTPAPEDMATAESLAGTNESLDGAIADIGELSDQLVGTVTEQNRTITDIQTYLNSLRKDLDAEIQSRQQWLNFNSAEGLVIGAAGSTFKTVTTNTSQQFRSGGTVLAETSGTEFVAPVMRSDQLLIGNWMWTRRDNGNLSLKWIG